MTRPKAVYLIGGGPLAAPVAEWARDCGLAPIVADRDPAAPGARDAEVALVLDGTDADAHVAAARELSARFDIRGAYCGGEHGVESARRVAEALGLQAPTRAAVATALDKTASMAAFRAGDLPIPGGVVLPADGAAEALAARVDATGRAWIVKPSGGSGSRGVRVVPRGATADDCARVLAEARAGAGGALIAEPFLIGRSIDANGCFLDGEYVGCGTLEKFETPLPARLPLGGEDPADLTAEDTARVHALVEAGARALGIDAGPVKGDLLWTEDGPVLLEVAPRFHGDVTSVNTLPFGSGVSPYHLWFRWLADGTIDASGPMAGAAAGHGAWRVICLPPGEVRRNATDAPGAPGAPEHPGITCAWFNPRCRASIPRYDDTTRIPGYVCAMGRDRAEAEARLADYLGALGVEVQADPAHAAWHRGLAEGLAQAGLDPRASGFGEGPSL